MSSIFNPLPFLRFKNFDIYYLGAVLLYILPGLPFTTSLIYNLFIDPGLSIFLDRLFNVISFAFNLIFSLNYSSVVLADPFSGELLGPPGSSVCFFIFIFIIIGLSILSNEYKIIITPIILWVIHVFLVVSLIVWVIYISWTPDLIAMEGEVLEPQKPECNDQSQKLTPTESPESEEFDWFYLGCQVYFFTLVAWSLWMQFG